MATAINYMDRAVLGILAHTLQVDLGWSERSYSHVVVAFTLAYGIGYIPAGHLMDRIGVKLGYAISVAIWTLAAMGHALVTSVSGFGCMRFLLGLGESGNFPAAIRAVSEWFAPQERALAVGIFNAGSNASALIAPFFIASLLARYGSWRAAFLGIGCLGLLWLVAWLLFPYNWLRQPANALGPSEDEQEAHVPESLETRGWKQLLSLPSMWAFIVAKACTDPVWWLYLLWLPKYLQERFHLSVAQIWMPLAIIYCAASFGAVAGGWLSGHWIRRGTPVILARRRMLLLCAYLALTLLSATSMHTLWAVVSLFSLLTAMHQGWAATLFAANADVFPRSHLSLAVGIAGAAGALGGALFQELTGYILQATHGDYGPIFFLATLAYPVSYVAFRKLVAIPNTQGAQPGARASS